MALPTNIPVSPVSAQSLAQSMLSDIPSFSSLTMDVNFAALLITLQLQGKSKEKALLGCATLLEGQPDVERLRLALRRLLAVSQVRENEMIARIAARTGRELKTKESAEAISQVTGEETQEQMDPKIYSEDLKARLIAALLFFKDYVEDLYAKHEAAPTPEQSSKVKGWEAGLMTVLSILPGALKPAENVDHSTATSDVPVWDWKTPIAFDKDSTVGKLLVAKLELIEEEIADKKNPKDAFAALEAQTLTKHALEQFFFVFQAQVAHQIAQSLGILELVAKEQTEFLAESNKIDATQALLSGAMQFIA